MSAQFNERMKRTRTRDPAQLAPQPDEPPSLLEELIAEPPGHRRIDGVVVARVRELLHDGRVAFEAEGLPDCGPARSLVEPAKLPVGAEIAVVFENGDPERGLVMGPIFAGGIGARAVVDGRELVLEAEREIILRCGAASLRLTRDGRIVLRGVHVFSRARETQRIKGGSVQIN